MKEWQFNVLFWTAVGGSVLLLIGPDIGLQSIQSPQAVGGLGAIVAYVLTQRDRVVKNNHKEQEKKKEEEDESS